MGNLFYDQLGLSQGMSAVAAPNIAVGPFNNLQPYLYWSCVGGHDSGRLRNRWSQPIISSESYSFGSGFQGTDLLANNLYVTAYFVGTRIATTGPVIAEVANAEGESPTIAPNTWVEIKGVNLAPAGDSRIWQALDFVNNQMPAPLDGVSVTVNGKSAYIYYISPTQINILTPPDAMNGAVQVVVGNNGAASASFTAQAQAAFPILLRVQRWTLCRRRSRHQRRADRTNDFLSRLYSGQTGRNRPDLREWIRTDQRPCDQRIDDAIRNPFIPAGDSDRRRHGEGAVCRFGRGGRVPVQRGDSAVPRKRGPADHGDLRERLHPGRELDYDTQLTALKSGCLLLLCGQYILNLLEVIQVVSREHADDGFDGLRASLVVHAVVLQLLRRECLEQGEICLAQHAVLL